MLFLTVLSVEHINYLVILKYAQKWLHYLARAYLLTKTRLIILEMALSEIIGS